MPGMVAIRVNDQKSRNTSKYGIFSFDYDEVKYEPTDLMKIRFLVNGIEVEELTKGTGFEVAIVKLDWSARYAVDLTNAERFRWVVCFCKIKRNSLGSGSQRVAAWAKNSSYVF